jgi:small GTP-binding protein
MDDPDEPACYKVIAIGGTGVGKTSIVQRYFTRDFQQPKQTIGAGYIKCVVPLVNGPVTLNVWDTAGQERFQSLIPLYLRGADACVLVFDLTDTDPIDSLDKLYNYVQSNLDSSVFVVVCGNKLDLLVGSEEPASVAAWADSKQVLYFTTSALNGQGIDELFRAVAEGVREGKEGVRISVPPERSQKNDCCYHF